MLMFSARRFGPRTLQRRTYSTAAVAAKTIVLRSILGQPSNDGSVLDTGLTVVHDVNPCPLAQAVLRGYQEAFPEAAGDGRVRFVPFTATTLIDHLVQHARPSNVVVLIQNHAFQNEMKTYRLRLKLWELGLKVAEHVHLAAVVDRDASAEMESRTIQAYLEACCLDPAACDADGKAVAAAIDDLSSGIVVHSEGGRELHYRGALDKCLLNTGTYYSGTGADGAEEGTANTTTLRPVGGSYPFGEVITESRRLSDVHGVARLFAFPNRQRRLEMASFDIEVEHGAIVGTSADAPQEFKEILALIREVEGGEAIIRELGIGLNPAIGRSRPLGDITAFERQRGVHVSLGKRHPLFVKRLDPSEVVKPYDALRRKDGKFHLDLFIDATHIAARHDASRVVARFKDTRG